MSDAQTIATVESNLPTVVSTVGDLAMLDSLLPQSSSEEMGAAIAFFPRITLVQPVSTACVKGGIKGGTFLLKARKNDPAVELESNFDVLPLDYRCKAMDFSDMDNIVIAYDLKSDEFARIQKLASQKGGKKPWTWGYEFLLYLPDQGVYAVLYCNNPTLQNFARNELQSYLMPKRRQACLSSQMVEDDENAWYGIKAVASQITMKHPLSIDDATKAIVTFQTHDPIENITKSADEAPSEQAR